MLQQSIYIVQRMQHVYSRRDISWSLIIWRRTAHRKLHTGYRRQHMKKEAMCGEEHVLCRPPMQGRAGEQRWATTVSMRSYSCRTFCFFCLSIQQKQGQRFIFFSFFLSSFSSFSAHLSNNGLQKQHYSVGNNDNNKRIRSSSSFSAKTCRQRSAASIWCQQFLFQPPRTSTWQIFAPN